MRHTHRHLHALALTLGLGLGAVAATAQQHTVIDLDLQGVDEMTDFTLTLGATHRAEDPLQTAKLEGGKVHFDIPSDGPRLYIIETNYPKGQLRVMADAGDAVRLTALADKRGPAGRQAYVFNAVQIKGSATHEAYHEKMRIRHELDVLYDQMMRAVGPALKKHQSLGRGTDEQRAYEQSGEWRGCEEAQSAFFKTVTERYDSLFVANSDTWWGPMLMLDVMNYVPAETRPRFDAMSAAAKASFYGQILAAQYPEEVSAEQPDTVPVPDFTFTDHASGLPTTLYAQLKTHRYVLLDIWASWCGPCRRELQNFKKQYEAYKDKGLQIVSISGDEDRAAWEKALGEEKMPWPNGLDADKSILRAYGVQFFPTVRLIDSEGHVIAADEGARGEQLQQLLERLLK